MLFSFQNLSFTKKFIRSADFFTPEIVDFSDRSIFPSKNLNIKMSTIDFFTKGSYILGFQQGYMDFQGFKNIIQTNQNYKTHSFTLKDKDYIVLIQGLISDHIESLKIYTKKGECFNVNYNENKVNKSQSFDIPIQKPLKFMNMFGGLDYFPSKNLWGLVYIGVEAFIIKEKNTSFAIKNEDLIHDGSAAFITQLQEVMTKRGKSAVNLNKK